MQTKTDILEIKFYSWWQHASGHSGGMADDKTVAVDKRGFPYISRTHIIGLVREAAREIRRLSPKLLRQDFEDRILGNEGDTYHHDDLLGLTDATLPKSIQDTLGRDKLIPFLTTSHSSVSLEGGVSIQRHLRSREVSVPMVLYARLQQMDDPDRTALERCFHWIKEMGGEKNRGYGRCQCRLLPVEEFTEPTETSQSKIESWETDATYHELVLDINLITPIRVLDNAMAVNPDITLDYIPGRLFRGLAAKMIYPKDAALAKLSGPKKRKILDLLHTGKVSYGDAHPVIHDRRCEKIPLSTYCLKGSMLEDDTIRYEDIKYDHEASQIYRQQKEGFFDTLLFNYFIPNRDLVTRTAIEENTGAAAEEQLFQAGELPAGLQFRSIIRSQDATLLDVLVEVLCGEHTFGVQKKSSRVEIKLHETRSIKLTKVELDPEIVRIYAASDMCFLSSDFRTRVLLNPEDLGITGGEIDWSSSSVSTRWVQLWNAKRNCLDSPRLVINKGSVFIIRNPSGFDPSAVWQGVGIYREEGLGEILVNPTFLNEPPSYKRQIRILPVRAALTDIPRRTSVFSNEWLDNLSQKKNKKTEEEGIREHVASVLAMHQRTFANLTEGDWTDLGLQLKVSKMYHMADENWSEFVNQWKSRLEKNKQDINPKLKVINLINNILEHDQYSASKAKWLSELIEQRRKKLK